MNFLASKRKTDTRENILGNKKNQDYASSTRRIILLKRNQLKIRVNVIIYSELMKIVNEFMQKFSIVHLWK